MVSPCLLFFILNFQQHLMYSLDLKTVNKVVYRREDSSIQATVGHDELTKIWSRPAEPVPALSRFVRNNLPFNESVFEMKSVHKYNLK